jgi:ATP-binding protein involved in chromosome partitioning
MAQAHKTGLDALLQVFRSVRDPELNQDLVSLGAIRDVKLPGDGIATFKIALSSSPGARAQVEKEVRSGLEKAGFTRAEFTVEGSAGGFSKTGGGVDASKAGSTALGGVRHIVAVSSGKGGVGKSTMSANLAAALALAGFRVGLMDADVYGPNIPTMMGLIDGPKMEQDPVLGEVFIPPTAHGIKVMSMGFLVPGDQPLVWRGPMLHSILNQFCNKVKWGELDFLIVDMPPGTGDVQLSLAQLVPLAGTVMVTTPQEVALQDVRKAYHMWEKVRVPVLGIVENMSYFLDDSGKRHDIFGKGGGAMLAKKWQLPLLAEVPIVTRVREGGDDGVPVVISDSKSSVAMQIRAMAEKVVALIQERGSAAGATAGVQIGKFE